MTLPTSPFWARRYTRQFLDSCRGISEDTAEAAELVVSELVTNAVRFSGDPARTLAVFRTRRRGPDLAVPAAFPRTACSSRFTTPTAIRRSCATPTRTPKTAGA